MESGENTVMEKLKDITKCSICKKIFTDPRILPCIHTFCLKCLQKMGSKTSKLGKTILCSVCGDKYVIPKEGFEKIPKNAFVENLIEMLQISGSVETNVSCDICRTINGESEAETPTSKTFCAECRQNICNDCEKRHRAMKTTTNHKVVTIGEGESGQLELLKTISNVKKPIMCEQHVERPLELYCEECREIACTTCVMGRHKSHNWAEVSDISPIFRQTIRNDLKKMSALISCKSTTEQLKRKQQEFLKELADSEKAILGRSEELKRMIDRQTKTLLDELNSIKLERVNAMDIERKEMESHLSILESLKVYCSELTSRGSSSDICRSVDEIHARTKKLKDKDASLYSQSLSSVHISFKITAAEDFWDSNVEKRKDFWDSNEKRKDLWYGNKERKYFQDINRKRYDIGSSEVVPRFQFSSTSDLLKQYNNNMVGRIEVNDIESLSCLVVVGLWNNESKMSDDVLKIDLQHRNQVTKLDPVPTAMTLESVAAVHDNVLYVSGVGKNKDEIWKYDLISKWSKCGSLVQGRRRQCATFLEDILYISGGFVDYNETVLNSVEAFDTSTDRCAAIGQLVHPVYSAASVACGSFLYVFGGFDKDEKSVAYVQVYNTIENQCTVLEKPMPRPSSLMRAVLWEKSVILLGNDNCFIFNVETETWKERREIKTDVIHFGLILLNESIYVVGGGLSEKEESGESIWKCRDDVRSMPLISIINNEPIAWTVHAAKLTKPSLVFACGGLKFPI